MYNKYITPSKHEFNVRRVKELNIEILAKEQQLKETIGFFNTLKVKGQINKLYRQINIHGNEVLQYEYKQAMAH